MGRPKLVFVAVAVEPTYVPGFPAHAAITIAADMPNAWLDVPWVGWRSSYGALGITLTRAGSTKAIARNEPLSFADPDGGMPRRRLRMREQRRTLIDLSDLLPAGLEPGPYDVTLSFGPEAIRAVSPGVRLVVRPPTEHESDELASVAAEVTDAGSWGRWTSMPPAEHGRPLRRRRSAAIQLGHA